MNIEVATEMLKRIYVTEFNTSSIYDNVSNVNLAIATLLTAYEKEKEKNKEARYYIYDALNNDDIINIGIDDMKIILDMLEE